MKENEQLPETVQPGETFPAVQLCPFGNFPGEKSMQVCDRAAFEQQMLNIVLGLSNQLKTGMSITQALQEVAKHASGAAGEELQIAVNELSMMDLDKVLDRLHRRVSCEDLLLMKSAISLTQKSGGGLSNIMGQLAETIRQRRDFRERLANRVAQGKFEAIMMACAPFAIFFLLLLIDTQLMLLLV